MSETALALQGPLILTRPPAPRAPEGLWVVLQFSRGLSSSPTECEAEPTALVSEDLGGTVPHTQALKSEWLEEAAEGAGVRLRWRG